MIQLGNETESSRDPVRECGRKRPRLNSGMWQEAVMTKMGNVTESSRNTIGNVAESGRDSTKECDKKWSRSYWGM